MNDILIKITIRRVFELMITCAVISAVITCLSIAEILTTQGKISIALWIGVAFFVFRNVQMLRQCYFEFRSDSIYFFVNMSAYLVFVGVTIAFYFLSSKECFTWLFAITKFAKNMTFNIGNLLSLVLFHIIGLLMVAFAPVGMSWVFMDYFDEDIDEEI